VDEHLSAPDAESAAIGCMLMDAHTSALGVGLLRAEDFFCPNHRAVYAAILELRNEGVATDLVTVAQKLELHQTLESVGGPPFLVDLMQFVPTTSNFLIYCRIIKEKANLRHLRETAQSTIACIDEGMTETPEILRAIISHLRAVERNGIAVENDSLAALMLAEYEAIGERASGRNLPIATRIDGIDNRTGGLTAGELFVIGAMPSVGKSALAMQMALALSEAGKRAIFFSLEMSPAMIAQRFFSAEGHIASQHLRTARMTEEEWNAATKAVSRANAHKGLMFDTRSRSISQIRARATIEKERNSLDAIFVDYLQIMLPEGRFGTRNEAVASLSAGLKRIAIDLNIPVICLSQLSRIAARSDAPTMADLRDSGAIEQDADVILLLHHIQSSTDAATQAHIDALTGTPDRMIHFNIAKNRMGETGAFDMLFDTTITRFVHLL
jgi:replicative DNA helicase